MTSTDLEEGLQYNKVSDVCLKRDCFQSTSTVYCVWCLPVSPKPDSPKLGLGVGVFQIRRNPIRRNPLRRN